MPDPNTSPPIPFTVAATAPKPGLQTTEFWMNIAITLIAAAVACGVVPAGGEAARIAAFATMALTNCLYILSRGQVKVAHAPGTIGDIGEMPDLGPFRTPPAEMPAAPTKQAGFVRLPVLVLLALFGAFAFAGCTPKPATTPSSARQTLITTVVASADAVAVGFAAFDKQHQHELSASATSFDDGKAKLEAYRSKRDAIVADLADLSELVKKAKAAKDDASLANVVAAAASVQALISALEGSK